MLSFSKINSKYFPYLFFIIVIVVLFGLNWRPNFLPTSDQAMLEYMNMAKHGKVFGQSINGYTVNNLYIFAEVVYLLSFVFSSFFIKYLLLLVFIVAFSYWVSFYILMRLSAGQVVLSSIFAPILFIPRFALGGEFWGMFSLNFVQGRSFYQPIALLLYFLIFQSLKSENTKKMFGAGILSGLSFMIYPGGGFYLPLITGLALFLLWIFKKCQFGLVLSFLIGYLVGMAPSLLNYVLNSDAQIGGVLSSFLYLRSLFDVAGFNELVHSRFPHIFGKGWSRMAAEVIILLIVILYARHTHRHSKADSKEIKPSDVTGREFLFFNIVFAAAVLLITFGIPLAQYLIVKIFNWPYFFFEQLRSSRYLYLPLLFILIRYLFLLYYDKRHKVFLLVFFLSFFGLRFFQPAINFSLYRLLPESFRQSIGVAKKDFITEKNEFEKKNPDLIDIANYLKTNVSSTAKIYIDSDDDVALNIRSISGRSTNICNKELSLFIIQDALNAVSTANKIQLYTSMIENGYNSDTFGTLKKDGFQYLITPNNTYLSENLSGLSLEYQNHNFKLFKF